MPLPTHSHAARVAAITETTLMSVRRSRPWSKVLTASPSEDVDWSPAPESRAETEVSSAALESLNEADSSASLSLSTNCRPRTANTP